MNNGAQIASLTQGEGDPGKIVINTSDTVSFNGRSANDSAAGAFSLVLGGTGDAGGIDIFAHSLSITNRAQLNGDTRGVSNGGDINIQVEEDVKLVNSIIIAEITEGTGVGEGGSITIETGGSLILQDGSSLLADTENIENAGDINIEAEEKVILEGEGPWALDLDSIVSSQITATVDSFEGSRGEGGSIDISTPFLSIADGGFIRTSTFGKGDAGNINIKANTIFVDGFDSDKDGSFIASEVNTRNEVKAEGEGGNIEIIADNLSITNKARISASTFSEGNAGDLFIIANSIELNGGVDGLLTGLFASVEEGGTGNGGSIFLGNEQFRTQQLTLNNGAQIVANTFSKGNAGDVSVFAKNIDLDSIGEFFSGLFAQVVENATGEGGSINLGSERFPIDQLNLKNGAQITVSTNGQGKAGEIEIYSNSLNLDDDGLISSSSKTNFNAGNITLDIANSLQAIDSEVSTNSLRSSGGNLTITAGDIELRGDSDLTTDVSSGEGSGGNINITADSIIAFDDSDIFASAPEGQGGNIVLVTPAFFAENFTLNSLTADPDDLDLNNRADINATGAVSSGEVSIPDISFIQNSLTELPDNSLNTDELVANSCVVPVGDRSQGKFIITGGESLPVRPGEHLPSKYPTGEVRGVTEDNTSSWQPGDPIVEPQGAYRLANEKLVLSRECPQ